MKSQWNSLQKQLDVDIPGGLQEIDVDLPGVIDQLSKGVPALGKLTDQFQSVSSFSLPTLDVKSLVNIDGLIDLDGLASITDGLSLPNISLEGLPATLNKGFVDLANGFEDFGVKLRESFENGGAFIKEVGRTIDATVRARIDDATGGLKYIVVDQASERGQFVYEEVGRWGESLEKGIQRANGDRARVELRIIAARENRYRRYEEMGIQNPQGREVLDQILFSSSGLSVENQDQWHQFYETEFEHLASSVANGEESDITSLSEMRQVAKRQATLEWASNLGIGQFVSSYSLALDGADFDAENEGDAGNGPSSGGGGVQIDLEETVEGIGDFFKELGQSADQLFNGREDESDSVPDPDNPGQYTEVDGIGSYKTDKNIASELGFDERELWEPEYEPFLGNPEFETVVQDYTAERANEALDHTLNRKEEEFASKTEQVRQILSDYERLDSEARYNREVAEEFAEQNPDSPFAQKNLQEKKDAEIDVRKGLLRQRKDFLLRETAQLLGQENKLAERAYGDLKRVAKASHAFLRRVNLFVSLSSIPGDTPDRTRENQIYRNQEEIGRLQQDLHYMEEYNAFPPELPPFDPYEEQPEGPVITE